MSLWKTRTRLVLVERGDQSLSVNGPQRGPDGKWRTEEDRDSNMILNTQFWKIQFLRCVQTVKKCLEKCRSGVWGRKQRETMQVSGTNKEGVRAALVLVGGPGAEAWDLTRGLWPVWEWAQEGSRDRINKTERCQAQRIQSQEDAITWTPRNIIFEVILKFTMKPRVEFEKLGHRTSWEKSWLLYNFTSADFKNFIHPPL